MENAENYDSTSCLLDDLMDNDIIRCDIDLGSSLLGDSPDDVLSCKGSPSHESDSGCSDMTENIRSVSPFLGFDPFEGYSTEPELDKELEMYFASPIVNKDIGRANQSEKENLETPSLMADMTSEPDVDCEDSDEEYVPPAWKPKSKVVHTRQTGGGKIRVGVSSSKPSSIGCVSSTQSLADMEVKKPAVKVVKVIKTPSTSKSDINNCIMQALDERNKKNAVQAKMNREKKKAYIKNLEDEMDALKTENFTLKETNRKTSREKSALEREVEYLRSVLANDSALSGLLKNINHKQNVQLSSTFSRKRSADHDHDYQSVKKARVGGGVCLHVDQGNVSLEFCAKCSSMANLTAEKS